MEAADPLRGYGIKRWSVRGAARAVIRFGPAQASTTDLGPRTAGAPIRLPIQSSSTIPQVEWKPELLGEAHKFFGAFPPALDPTRLQVDHSRLPERVCKTDRVSSSGALSDNHS